MFSRLKRIVRVIFLRSPGDVQGLERDLDALRAVFEEQTRDMANVHTALQRIERKQLRWIELLNLKNEMKEKADGVDLPAGSGVTAYLKPGGALLNLGALSPGAIVD